MPPPNLFADLSDHQPGELFQTLLTTAGVRIERIVSHGHASPEGFWYDQDQHEWVLLLRGAARLTFEGEPALHLAPGSYVHIPAHRRHRVDWTDPTQPTVWLAIHYDDADARVQPNRT
jgi:cupin 2 domain-containing protein